MRPAKHSLKTVLAAVILLVLAAGCAPPASSTSVPVTGVTPALPAAATNTPQPPAETATTEMLPTSTTEAMSTESQPTATQQSGASMPAGALVWSIEAGQGQARYRVTEQLVGNDLPNEAIGKTNQVTGQIVFLPDGSIDPSASQFTVDVSSLKTDISMRDGFVSRNVLQSDQYPQAVFVPKAISGLAFPLPQSGDFTFQISGDLTIRNVTKTVTWDVTGKIDGNKASGLATTTFNFAEFELTQPRVGRVLSIEDKITLELEAAVSLVQP